jgi:hypothetical protein
MATTKVKIEKLEKINNGVLFIYYRAINLNTNEIREQKNALEFFGSDIINFSSLTEEQLKNIPTIHGKKHSEEFLVSSEIREYSENFKNELKKEGWEKNISNAIEYVLS